MSNGAADCRNLDAITQQIVEVEASMMTFQRLLNQGFVLPTDMMYLTWAERLLKDLYAQRQIVLSRWRAQPDSSPS